MALADGNLETGGARGRARVADRDDVFAPGFRAAPYWLDDLPARPVLTERPPKRADVLVIGSGYTGLNAALETARGGRSTVVLEAGEPGEGCSTRNGGQISTCIKPLPDELSRRYGKERAKAIRAEGQASLEWIGELIAREGIDCGFARSGRFHAAHTPRHYEMLARGAERVSREEGFEAWAVPRAEMAREMGSPLYAGGVVVPSHARVHPAQYHRGLLTRVLEAGAQVVPHCPASGIERAGDGFEVATPHGTIAAREVVVATNGYTSGLTPWLQRRVIPIGSYVIATEPLPEETIARAFPTRRIASDTRRVVYYFAPSPDGRRIVFGGRVSAGESDPLVTGPRLHAEMARIFPDLAGARISHSWSGTVAYTFDTLPHCGSADGLHFAMGYCGSGVAMASYLGMRTGRRVLGQADGATAFDDLPFPTRPLYGGRPWFLPAAVAWYRFLDGLDLKRAARQPEACTA